MENKINIAELLKDCPKGMELDCTMFENVTFEGIKQDKCYPIIVKIKEPLMILSLTKYGGWNSYNSAKCIIFPKGKTTWEGFVAPYKFKDGDVCYIKTKYYEHIFIFKFNEDYKHIHGYVDLSENTFFTDENSVCTTDTVEEIRLATEEEKAKLFNAIKSHGYKWNDNTKTLEKLSEPKFKVGDRIKSIISSSYYTVVDIKNDQYFIKSDTEKYPYQVHFSNEINYKLVPNKFDINTLVPFESRVLMRSSNAREWVGTFYSHYSDNKFYGCGMCCDQCIPYEGNEHLRGTTNDCDEYFKNW